ncbi:hypothetical protein MLD38_002095 [Melastoma candidum]|uniref:Uncharacterized protein n=1 Tax=Melastoma candidum TaxID=119954 RepID=A0ACB9SJC3_9MYRT|nr:hypothetical protein MLD38_002095 [Melastoma candidum]
MSGFTGFGGIGLIARGFCQRGTEAGDDLDLIRIQPLERWRKIREFLKTYALARGESGSLIRTRSRTRAHHFSRLLVKAIHSESEDSISLPGVKRRRQLTFWSGINFDTGVAITIIRSSGVLRLCSWEFLVRVGCLICVYKIPHLVSLLSQIAFSALPRGLVLSWCEGFDRWRDRRFMMLSTLFNREALEGGTRSRKTEDIKPSDADVDGESIFGALVLVLRRRCEQRSLLKVTGWKHEAYARECPLILKELHQQAWGLALSLGPMLGTRFCCEDDGFVMDEDMCTVWEIVDCICEYKFCS